MQLRYAHLRWNKGLGVKGKEWLKKNPWFEVNSPKQFQHKWQPQKQKQDNTRWSSRSSWSNTWADWSSWNDWGPSTQISGWDGYADQRPSTAMELFHGILGNAVQGAMHPIVQRMDTMQQGIDLMMSGEEGAQEFAQRRLLRWSKVPSRAAGAFYCQGHTSLLTVPWPNPHS